MSENEQWEIFQCEHDTSHETSSANAQTMSLSRWMFKLQRTRRAKRNITALQSKINISGLQSAINIAFSFFSKHHPATSKAELLHSYITVMTTT